MLEENYALILIKNILENRGKHSAFIKGSLNAACHNIQTYLSYDCLSEIKETFPVITEKSIEVGSRADSVNWAVSYLALTNACSTSVLNDDERKQLKDMYDSCISSYEEIPGDRKFTKKTRLNKEVFVTDKIMSKHEKIKEKKGVSLQEYHRAKVVNRRNNGYKPVRAIVNGSGATFV